MDTVRHLRLVFGTLCALLAGGIAEARAFEHPGGLHSRSQIESVRKKIAAREEPWTAAYRSLLEQADRSLARSPEAVADFNVPGYYSDAEGHRNAARRLSGDAWAAYSCAIAYQLTAGKEKTKYADKAVEMLGAWAKTNRKASNADGSLVMAYAGSGLVFAAELLTDFDGWKGGQREEFKAWVRAVYLRSCSGILGRPNNWGDWGVLGSIAAHHFLDDAAALDADRKHLRERIDKEIAADGSMPHEAGRGQNGMWYTYFALAPLTAACQIALNARGDDIFHYRGKSGTGIEQAMDYLFRYCREPEKWPHYRKEDLSLPKPGGVARQSLRSDGRHIRQEGVRRLGQGRPPDHGSRAPLRLGGPDAPRHGPAAPGRAERRRPVTSRRNPTGALAMVCGLWLAGGMAGAPAAEPGGDAAGPKAAAIEPVLAADPAVEAALKGLGENQSALLPAVKTVGNMSEEVRKFRMDKTGPRPRDYCLKWVWAADRKRALFCGGNAGVPHKLNDVWEYDLAANTWVLLWEPDPDTNRVRRMKPQEAQAYLDAFVTVDKASGEIMTKRGAPFDPVHTWWGLTYDPELHALLWVMGNHHLHDSFLKMHPELAGDYKLGGFHKMRMWAYYPFEHRWEFMKVPTEPLKSPAAMLEYIPELKGSLWYTATHKQTAVFRSKDKSWTGFAKLAPNDQTWRQMTNLPGSEAVAAYDTANKLLVAHLGGNTRNGQPTPKCTYHYTPASNKWERAVESDEGPVGFDSKGPMVYDSAAGRCYIVHDGLWSYRVEDRKWEKLAPQGPPAPNGMACYNPDRNVLMVDSGKGQVWVYRGRRSPPPAEGRK